MYKTIQEIHAIFSNLYQIKVYVYIILDGDSLKILDSSWLNNFFRERLYVYVY